MNRMKIKLSYIFVVLLSSIFALSLLASTKEIVGEGRFMAEDDDNLTFVKKILLSSAFEDIVTKELNSLGLNSKLFWRQFNEQFEKSFASVDQELKKKYQIDQPTSAATAALTDEQKKKNQDDFKQEYRQKRLLARTRFANLSSAVNQYKVLEMSRSTQLPKSRYLKVSAKVDIKELNSLYLKMVGASSTQNSYRRLVISTSFNLQGTNWSDLGVEVPSEFETTIAEHWLKWWKSGQVNSVEEIILASSSDIKEYQEYFKLSDDAKDSAELANNPRYQDVLWLQLSFTIKKKSSNSLQGTRGFSFSGDYVLTDLGQNRVLSFSEFSKPVQNFSYEQDHKLRSAVATAIYAIPLEQFVSVKSQLQSNNLKTNQFYLDVLNVGNINDLFKLERLLISRGVTLQLSSSVSSLNQGKARIKISIVGDGEQLMKFLNSIHQQEIENIVVLQKDRSRPYELSLQVISGAKNE